MQILFCDTLLSIRIVYIFKIVLNIIRFVIPIILIIKLTLEAYKNIINSDNKSNFLVNLRTKLIAAIIIFLVPTFINLLFSFIAKTNSSASYYKDSFPACYDKVNKEFIDNFAKNN